MDDIRNIAHLPDSRNIAHLPDSRNITHLPDTRGGQYIEKLPSYLAFIEAAVLYEKVRNLKVPVHRVRGVKNLQPEVQYIGKLSSWNVCFFSAAKM